jgi:hypothetical protein
MRHSFLLLLFSCCSKKKEPKVFDYLGPKICDRRKFVTAETPDPKGGEKTETKKEPKTRSKTPQRRKKASQKRPKKEGQPFLW